MTDQPLKLVVRGVGWQAYVINRMGTVMEKKDNIICEMASRVYAQTVAA